MAIENVFNPPTLNEVDPNAKKPPGDKDTTYWTKMAEQAKAMMDYQQYVHAMRMLGQNPDNAPFKVTGEVSMGKVDLQEQARQAQEAQQRSQEAANKQIEAERARGDNLQGQLYTERMDNLRSDFDAKFNLLTKTIVDMATSNKKNDKPFHEQFAEQFTALQEIAKQLGLEKTATGQDPNVQLELARIQYQQSREDREFKWKMKQDEKSFALQMRQFDENMAIGRAKLAQDERRMEMIASFPEQIGADILQGSQARSKDRGTSQRDERSFHIELGEGESAVTSCPYCKTEIGVGPTTSAAQCVNCNRRYQVIRKAHSAEPIPSEEK